MNPYCR